MNDAKSVNENTPNALVKADTPNAFKSFEVTINALKHENILIKGGLAAYVIYAVAVLFVFFLVLRAFVDLSAIVSQIIQAFLAILSVGVAAGVIIEYLKYKKEDSAARYQLDALRLRVQIASQRSTEFMKLLQTWSGADSAAFERIVGRNPDLLKDFAGSLDQAYSRLGLEGSELTSLIERAQKES